MGTSWFSARPARAMHPDKSSVRNEVAPVAIWPRASASRKQHPLKERAVRERMHVTHSAAAPARSRQRARESCCSPVRGFKQVRAVEESSWLPGRDNRVRLLRLASAGRCMSLRVGALRMSKLSRPCAMSVIWVRSLSTARPSKRKLRSLLMLWMWGRAEDVMFWQLDTSNCWSSDSWTRPAAHPSSDDYMHCNKDCNTGCMLIWSCVCRLSQGIVCNGSSTPFKSEFTRV